MQSKLNKKTLVIMISNYYKNNSIELYDLDKDPYESVNLNLSEPKIADKLLKKLNNWKTEINAID